MNTRNELRQPAKCVVKIDGRDIDSLYNCLEQVSVETSRNNASVCTLNFASVRDEFGQWSVQDSGILAPWKSILIEAHFGEEKEEIMRGFIRDIRMEYPDDMNANVVVTGQDESILLDRAHVRKTYSTLTQPLRDDALIRELLKPHWTGGDVEASAGVTCGNLYFDGTPIRLIKRRAELNGYEFWIREGKAYFGPPNLEGSPQPDILIYAGAASNCMNISVFHDGHKPDGVLFSGASEDDDDKKNNFSSWSAKSSPLGSTQANSKNMGMDDFNWYVQMPQGSTQEEREAYARAKAEEASWKIRATGELDGSMYGHALQTNRTVTVNGVGGSYGGIWYVDEVKHSFSIDGYRQAFTLIRNATGEIDMTGAPYSLAGVSNR